MFKKKLLLGIIPILGITAVGAIAATRVNDTVEVPAVAEEAEPVINEGEVNGLLGVTVNKIFKINGSVDSKIYENNNINSQEDVDKTIDEVNAKIKEKGAYGNDYTSETIITFGADNSLYLRGFSKGRFTINLNGHTWTVTTKRTWKFHEGLNINGGNGTITTDRSQSGTFELVDYADYLNVNNTTFRGFNNGRYPIFEVRGWQKKGVFPKVKFNNCTFENCKSKRYGGIFYSNLAGQTEFSYCTFKDCKSGRGGLFYIEKPWEFFIVADSTISNCSADYGGVAYYDGNAVGKEYRVIHAYMRYCTITNCKANDDGGVAYANEKEITLDFSHSTVKDCSASDDGGAVYLNKAGAWVSYGTFENCSAKRGGAVFIDAKDGHVDHNTFKYCRASKKGNAIFSKYEFYNADNTFVGCNEIGDEGNPQIIFVEGEGVESVQAPSSTPIWVMGSLILAAIIGSTIAICLVFRKKKEA